jgi:hypothetical protein
MASAAKKALEAERRAAFEKIARARYDARKAIRQSIRDIGKKPTDYSMREINEWAEAIARY